MKAPLRYLCACALLVLTVSRAQAAPLGIELNAFPDIFSDSISLSYSNPAFSATGIAQGIDPDGNGFQGITGGGFQILASIDGSGNLLSGTITITGTVPGLGFNSGTLLTGNLTAFGFSGSAGNGDDILEFLFTPTGGDAASLYGEQGGVILTQTSFPGDFSGDFQDEGGFGVADVGVVPIPEPATLTLAGILVAAGTIHRRALRRRRQD